MSDDKLTIVARFRARASKENEARELLLSLVKPAQAEAGCIDYCLHEDPKDKTQFLFYENWENQKALDEHMQKPYVRDLMDKAEELFAEPLPGDPVPAERLADKVRTKMIADGRLIEKTDKPKTKAKPAKKKSAKKKPAKKKAKQ